MYIEPLEGIEGASKQGEVAGSEEEVGGQRRRKRSLEEDSWFRQVAPSSIPRHFVPPPYGNAVKLGTRFSYRKLRTVGKNLGSPGNSRSGRVDVEARNPGGPCPTRRSEPGSSPGEDAAVLARAHPDLPVEGA
jgi:hypothetical protein